MTALSLVIPCYNEVRSLEELVERTARALAASDVAADDFELVLVDNGSSDGTWELMAELSGREQHAFLRPHRVVPNRGYGHGMLSGLQVARGVVLATTHADLQTDPADVFRAYSRYREANGRVVVKGVRRGRSVPNVLVSRLFDTASLLLLQRALYEVNAQPKVFSADLLASLTDPPLDFRFDLYLLLQALDGGARLETITVTFPPRKHGESHWAATTIGRWRTFAGFLGYMARYRIGELTGRR